jgi:hypothetical protein
MDKMRAARAHGESKTDVAKVGAGTPHVWDGKNEDEGPLTRVWTSIKPRRTAAFEWKRPVPQSGQNCRRPCCDDS